MPCTNEASGCSPNMNFSWQSAICSFSYFLRLLICPFAFALFWRESLPHSDLRPRRSRPQNISTPGRFRGGCGVRSAVWFSRLLEVFMRSDFFSETELARIRIQSCREPARSPLTICRPYGRAGLEFLLLEGQDGSFW